MAVRIFPTDTKTIKVVVLSLVAATTFWFFLKLNDEYSATIYYPIKFEYDQVDFVATEELPDEVQINVSGGGWSILRQGYLFDAEPIYLPVEDPERSTSIAGASLIVPLSEGLTGLVLNFILDDTLHLSIEKKISKKVLTLVDSANVDLSNDHYIVSEVLCDLDSVELTGPRSIIESYPDTVIINIKDRRVDSNYDRDVEIDVFNEFIQLSRNTARITFDVEEFVEVNRRITLTKNNFPEDSTILLADTAIDVRFKIRESRATQFENEEFMIVVDYNKMITFDSTIQALIMKYPLDIRGLNMGTSRVKVIKLEQ
jgi:hypothetical protein